MAGLLTPPTGILTPSQGIVTPPQGIITPQEASSRPHRIQGPPHHKMGHRTGSGLQSGIGPIPNYGTSAQYLIDQGYPIDPTLLPVAADYPDMFWGSPIPGGGPSWQVSGVPQFSLFTGTPNPIFLVQINYAATAFIGPAGGVNTSSDNPRTIVIRGYNEGSWGYNPPGFMSMFGLNIGGTARCMGWLRTGATIYVYDGANNQLGSVGDYARPNLVTFVIRQTSTTVTYTTNQTAGSYTENLAATGGNGTLYLGTAGSSDTSQARHIGCLIWQTAEYIDDATIDYWMTQYIPSWQPN